MRKVGFWRWASRKAYNRLVVNGRIWADKGDSSVSMSGKDSAISEDVIAEALSSSGDKSAEQVDPSKAEGTSQASGVKSSVSHGPLKMSTSTATTSPYKRKGELDNDDWITHVVSAKSLVKTPSTGVTLIANGGLSKFKVKPRESFTVLGHRLSKDSDGCNSSEK